MVLAVIQAEQHCNAQNLLVVLQREGLQKERGEGTLVNQSLPQTPVSDEIACACVKSHCGLRPALVKGRCLDTRAGI